MTPHQLPCFKIISMAGLSAAMLAACVTAPAFNAGDANKGSSWGSQTTPKPTEQAVVVVYAGRFSASYTKDGKPQRDQGRFEWKTLKASQNSTDTGQPQLPDASQSAMQIALLSPVGTTVAVIAYAPKAAAGERASLSTASHTYTAPDLDELMQNTLGWRLPLLGLLPWLATNAPPSAPPNWGVEVMSRQPSGMPKIIAAQNLSQGITVRLVFEEADAP
jgi:outer membrane biogenesis lipoprotein LolB